VNNFQNTHSLALRQSYFVDDSPPRFIKRWERLLNVERLNRNQETFQIAGKFDGPHDFHISSQ